ncbi:MAG: hypothetical protein KTR14_09150, partial [Vampirovibrio sp.]|nr:hypothetical protein [Vampirovibrio sp.]
MNSICYSLTEAAQRLEISETILVRLSQYFKVPEDGYDEEGYLSFKGDLLFMDDDLAFFRRVHEQLLAGKSLEAIKATVQPGEKKAVIEAVAAPLVETAVEPSIEVSHIPLEEPDDLPAQTVPTDVLPAQPVTSQIFKVDSRQPDADVAAKEAQAQTQTLPEEAKVVPEPSGPVVVGETVREKTAPEIPTDKPPPTKTGPFSFIRRDGLVEVEDSKAYQQTAEKGLNDYKERLMPPPPPVFRKMADEVKAWEEKENGE